MAKALISPEPEHGGGEGEVHRRERLAGLLNYYYRKAAWESLRPSTGIHGVPSTVAAELATLQSGLLVDYRAGN